MDELPHEIQLQIVQVLGDDAQKSLKECNLPLYLSREEAWDKRGSAGTYHVSEWLDLSRNLSALLGLTLISTHWCELAKPTLYGCLDCILRYLWSPPWQDTWIIKPWELRPNQSLGAFIDTVFDLPESYRAWAVRKMAPDKPYRFAIEKHLPATFEETACHRVWAQGLPEDYQNTQIASHLAVLKGSNEDFIMVEYIPGSDELELSTSAMVNRD